MSAWLEADAEEDDVAGHVSHEDMPEAEVAEGVDEPGHRGQYQHGGHRRAAAEG
jgi:hypothetical protein